MTKFQEMFWVKTNSSGLPRVSFHEHCVDVGSLANPVFIRNQGWPEDSFDHQLRPSPDTADATACDDFPQIQPSLTSIIL